MRILITGGCGFLGAHLIEHLLKNTDATIIVLDRMTYASQGFDRLRDVANNVDGMRERVTLLGCDLSQPIPDGISQEVGQVDYVIHAAAETHVDNSIVSPLPFIMANVVGTHHLLWWARDQKSLRRVFLVSTDEVYGPAAWDHPGNHEGDPFRPANPYAAAKAGGEAIGMAYQNTYRLPVTIVNTMNLYGERQHQEKYIPLVIRSVLQGKRVTIHADPTRTRSGTRFYIHARNFASALLYLMDVDLGACGELEDSLANELTRQDGATRATGKLPIKLHVAGEREVSNLDLAMLIAGYLGRPLDYDLVDFHSSRPGHDLRYALNDNAIRALGWNQPVTFFESLERTVRWYVNNPRWIGMM